MWVVLIIAAILTFVIAVACMCGDYTKTAIVLFIIAIFCLVGSIISDYHANNEPRPYDVDRVVIYSNSNIKETVYLFYLKDDYGKTTKIVKIYIPGARVHEYYKGNGPFMISKAELNKSELL